MEVIAHYLPQFHPIPENDEWWGPGFTEWTNVTRARPLFRGHDQPHLPADLGFYDLRVPEARQAQAELARRYGVTAFCYWHYWFAGRRLLERPFDEVLASGTPDLPFCLAWANQTWSGIWHGAPNRILIEQTYADQEDVVRHFEYLLPAFRDERYLRIDGRPALFIYKPSELPEPARYVEHLQELADAAGLGGLYLIAALGETPYATHRQDGFDAGVYYQFPFAAELTPSPWARTWTRVRGRLTGHYRDTGPKRHPFTESFPEIPGDLAGPIFPCVYPNWDNTPRSGRGGVVGLGATPERFGAHLRRALEITSALPSAEQVLVIKSWNEWAEGNYLEPDRETGHARGEILAAELQRVNR